ncbi:efflux RND transporter periplasmic adaptor subunit [Enterocloster lavalensis]|uniref:efflux RND transporter periplasmic adaptor subunit n=1 Tax=Enterocloster lavalensis TaxID=460384 RepID=UPI001D071796|nr:efflux RND transporter periplasmic adaptor subunit [Enterocloster lavalensis]MCB6343229.1 efflux RND transporter periplasmic adaptor subunit [Enterocloster lavalensis]
MRRKKAMIIGGAALVAVAAAVLLLGGGKDKAAGGPAGGPRGGAMSANVPVVKAVNPTRGDIRLTSGLTGTVEPADVVYVYAKASGDVTAVMVKAGDTVTAGQVLCEIDTKQVETARNSLDAAEVSLSEARSNLNRMQILYASGDLSAQDYEQYSNKAKSAQLQYESAKLAYDRQVEYSTVTAPIGGRVESCDIEVHDSVGQSTQLCVIAGEGDKRVSFYVTERMMANITVGDQLDITKNGTAYKAYVSEISAMVDADTGLFKVKAQLEGADAIPTGSTVKLSLVTDRTENAILVPVDAIYYSNGDGYVYLYRDGEVERTAVEVGIYDSQNAEILGGLNMDDLVISTWSSDLYEGAKVELKGAGGAGDAAGQPAGEARGPETGPAGGAGGQSEGGVGGQGAGSSGAGGAGSAGGQGADGAGGAGGQSAQTR